MVNSSMSFQATDYAECSSWLKMESSNGKRIILNISGEIFETRETTLDRFPRTLLGNPKKRKQFLALDGKEYYFNRNRGAFEAILYFYQSGGRLTCPANVEFETFENECNYFELPDSVINEMKIKEGLFIRKVKYELESNSFLNRVWKFTERPESSRGAQIFALFSHSMILLSVIHACLESLPVVQRWMSQNSLRHLQVYLEYAMNGWFLFELLLRIAASPKKCKFFKAPMNIIDVLSVGPYVIMKIINWQVSYHKVLRVLRFLRMFRLFRIGKHSQRMKLVGKIFMSTVDDIKELLLCLVIVIIFGGSIVYYAEMDQRMTNFTSIPQALWWAVQTVVVLGYGDIVPTTLIGKITASLFMVFGALTIALPVLSVVTKFSTIYKMNTKAKQ